MTSGNRRDDLKTKVAAYARTKVPVYVIVDREHQRVHVLTEPVVGGYDNHQFYAPGQSVTLPDVIGAKATLEAAEILAAGRPRKSD